MKKNEKRFVGVDDGFFSIKVFTGDKSISIPSRAAKGITLVDSGDGDTGFIFNTDSGDTFTVDANVPGALDTRTLTTDYPVSNVNRVLVHAALVAAGLGGEECEIVTGLPVSHYYLPNTDKNEFLVSKKKESISKPVTCGVEGNTPVAQISRNEVCSEAIAAFIDQMIDNDGNQTANADSLKNGVTCVIDIGGQTTDCAVLNPGMRINMQRSGSSEVGVLYLYDEIKIKLATKFSINISSITKRQVESALKNGSISIYREVHDVSHEVEQCKASLFDRIQTAINEHVGDDSDIETLIFVGGGAIVFGTEIQNAYRGALIPAEPEFANARGMYKLIRFMAR
ncbi:ParM/StbA family protein [Citrobacter freundii]|uniref:ParM/StbA family protein n=1 Tax=Citrobacter freundii TaxID=546 RepID=UPI001908471F|nr:ParM/StbA family protein [Citrobacter freundii]MBJ8931589.1 ParM/StbA family protein [Citrobacter freundii]